MRGIANQKLLGAYAVPGLLAAMVFLFAGIGQAAPEIPWAKPYIPRAWTYATGTKVTAAYDFYKDGNVNIIADNDSKQSIPLAKFGADDQAWVLNELQKPRGLINDVVFGQWQDHAPLFWVNTSFFTKGNLVESPVVYVQYLLIGPRKRVVKRICDPVILYPTVGKQNLEQMGTKVRKQCLGTNELDVAGVKMLAYRAVMLLMRDNKKEWLVLDTLLNQNEGRLQEQGVPLDWWEPRYPFGEWSSSGGTGVKK